MRARTTCNFNPDLWRLSELKERIYRAPFLGRVLLICSNSRYIKFCFFDYFFFVAAFLVPSYGIGFIPLDFSIAGILDVPIITLMLSSVILIRSISSIKTLSSQALGKSLILCALYVVFRLIFSFFSDIPAAEVAKAFRKEFYTPISCLAFVLYSVALPASKIVKFIKWYLLIILIQSAIYLLQTFSGIPIFPTIKENLIEEVGMVSIRRDLSGLPINIGSVAFAIITLLFIYTKRVSFSLSFALLLAVVVGSLTRSLIISSIVSFVFVGFGYLRLKGFRDVASLGRIAVFTIFVVFLFFSIFPRYFDYLDAKFSVTFNEELKDNTGTYSVRQKLNVEAFQRLENSEQQLFGVGYQRASVAGQYDFVFGGDTHIAPVIYCEGFLGLAVRVLPILILLWTSFRRLFMDGANENASAYAIILAVIVAHIIAYMQTPIFRNYLSSFFVLYLLILLTHKLSWKRN